MADDATRDLEKAMPALDAAVDALEKLDKKSIAEALLSLTCVSAESAKFD